MAYADARTDPALEPSQAAPKKKVVVLGTGWAGTTFVRNVDSSLYDVQVISPRNYFAFTPLLPSVTCGTVEPRSIVEPIRKIIRKVCTRCVGMNSLSSLFLCWSDPAILDGSDSLYVKNLLLLLGTKWCICGTNYLNLGFKYQLDRHVLTDMVRPSTVVEAYSLMLSLSSMILSSSNHYIARYTCTKIDDNYNP